MKSMHVITNNQLQSAISADAKKYNSQLMKYLWFIRKNSDYFIISSRSVHKIQNAYCQ